MARTTNRPAKLVEQLAEALAEVDDSSAVVTSVRQPAALKKALQAAVALGWARTANEGTVNALHNELVRFSRHLALEAHTRAHPDSAPTLAGTALALAELDHDPLADEPALLARAAKEVVGFRSDASPDDVLVWAASMRASRRA